MGPCWSAHWSHLHLPTVYQPDGYLPQLVKCLQMCRRVRERYCTDWAAIKVHYPPTNICAFFTLEWLKVAFLTMQHVLICSLKTSILNKQIHHLYRHKIRTKVWRDVYRQVHVPPDFTRNVTKAYKISSLVSNIYQQIWGDPWILVYVTIKALYLL